MKILKSIGLFFILVVATLSSTVDADEFQKLGNAGYRGLQHCTMNYGTIVIKEVAMSDQTIYVLSQIGMSSSTPVPLARHTAMRSGCYTLVADESSARFAMTAEIKSLSTQMVDNGPALASAVCTMELKEVQVILTIVDLRTGKVVAGGTGTGDPSNFIKGSDLLDNIRGKAPDIKSKEMKIVATAFVNAFNKLIPFVDKPSKVLKAKALR